jgi:hypothetical protein
VLGVIDLPPEIMPLAALLGPLLVVLITLWTSPKNPEEPKPDTTVTDH